LIELTSDAEGAMRSPLPVTLPEVDHTPAH
jgi:hypothetical protein